MRYELVLLGLTALAVTLTTADAQTSPEPVVIRCKRPHQGLCMQLCEQGHQTDENGCPRCDCLEDPCLVEDTCVSEEGEESMCQSMPTCTTDPCVNMEHKCVAMPPCPMPMCSQSCEYGYKKDSRGCMSCECKANSCEGHQCPKDHSCVASAPNLPFFHETLSKICLPDLHKPDFVNLFPTHPMGFEPEEFPPLCTFREMFFAEMKKQIYDQIPNPPQHLQDSLSLKVNCEEDGTFLPVQCNYRLNTCWCVNDVGLEIKGSRVSLANGQEEPDCEQYQTTKVEITMVIIHNFDDVNEHMDGIKETLVDQLSAWLEIDGKYIEIDAILPHKDQANLIKVDLTITHDGITDLAFVAERFKFDTKKTPHVITCHGQDMTVDGQSVSVKHTSKPVSDLNDEDSDEDMETGGYKSRCNRLWRQHKGLVFVAGFGVLVLFLVILGFCVAACRKRKRASAQFKHEKMDKYKENLAYQNQVYGHPDLAEEEDKEKDVKVLGMEFGKDGKPTAKY